MWISWFHLIWNMLIFLNVYIDVFYQIWETFSHYFSKYSLFLLLEFPNKPMLIYLMVSHSSLRLSFLQSVFFLFFRFSAFYCYILKFADYFFFPLEICLCILLANFSMSLFVLFFGKGEICLVWKLIQADWQEKKN